MQIITLTTDWGNNDWFTGQMKGMLYSAIPNLQIVDITHNNRKYNINTAAFVIRNACFLTSNVEGGKAKSVFPKGTIHIIDVDSYEDIKRGFVVVECDEQFYICTDNGLPSLLFENKDVKITNMVHIASESNFYTSAATDVFYKAAKVLANTHSTETIGDRIDEFQIKKFFPRPNIRQNSIECNVMYIDSYGDVYLNITGKEFLNATEGKTFKLKLEKDVSITQISSSYQDPNIKGGALLTISSTQFLELADRGGNFSRLFGFKEGDKIQIELN